MGQKSAVYGTVVVLVHASIVGLHSIAHSELGMKIAPFNAVVVILAALSAAMLWTSLRRVGAALLVVVMAASFVLATYSHFIAHGADFVGKIGDVPGGALFRITAALRPLAELTGCLVGVRALLIGAGGSGHGRAATLDT
jgi:hypothetical protein